MRRELKNAVALLETIALQTRVEHADQSALEDEARALELQRAPGREAMRARLLADHAASDRCSRRCGDFSALERRLSRP